MLKNIYSRVRSPMFKFYFPYYRLYQNQKRMLYKVREQNSYETLEVVSSLFYIFFAITDHVINM